MPTMIRPKMLVTLFGTLVVLGLGATVISLAGPPEVTSTPTAANKKALRDRVVQLRTEIEILELDREASKDTAKQAFKKEREERLEAKLTEVRVRAERSRLLEAALENFRSIREHRKDKPKEYNEFLKRAREVGIPINDGMWRDEDVRRYVLEEEKKLERKEEADNPTTPPSAHDGREIDRVVRRELRRLISELNEKRLDLEEAEDAYRHAR